MPRMKILDKSSFSAFNTPPEFTSQQRKSCFEFSNKLMNIAIKFREPSTQIGFLVSWGYFKISKRFYAPENFNIRDITYVARTLGYNDTDFHLGSYTSRTRQRHQLEIIRLFGFTKFDAEYEEKLSNEITSMVRQHLKPKLIFWRCVDIMIAVKISFPTYYRIQKLVLTTIADYKSELNSIIEKHLTYDSRTILDSLCEQESESNKFRLTLLKKPSQAITPAKIKSRLVDMTILSELHGYVEPTLKQLCLPPAGIHYFSVSVIKSKTSHLLRREQSDTYLHLISFIEHQYYHLQDNLVDVFLGSVKTTENTSSREHKDWCYTHRTHSNKNIAEKIDNLKLDVSGIFAAIRAIITSQCLSEKEKLKNIKALISPDDLKSGTFNKFNEISEVLSTNLDNVDNYYNILEKRSVRLQNRVSGILKTLTFKGDNNSSHLVDAIWQYKNINGSINSSAPLDFLSSDEKKALNVSDAFRTSLYKVFLFQHVARAIKSGSLNLVHSYKYRSMDSYLINKNRWFQEKEQLLERAGMTNFANSKPLLQELEKKLYEQCVATNNNISSGSNPHIKFSTDSKYSIHTPRQEEILSELFSPLLPVKNFIPLAEILATVNSQTRFTKELQHWQQQYNRDKAVSVMFAGIIGLGCAIGVRKMARISRQMGEEELDNAVNWHLSLENIRSANDCVVRYMDTLELPNIYRRSLDSLHTASDGQKFEVPVDSLNANYSFKYFGKGQGVSVYTFVDERNLLWHSLVFSAAERESAYVIDGLMRNDVVKSDIHSTDTHGYSEVIFAVTYLLGFSFAPRIKNLKKQVLSIFKSTDYKCYDEWPIKPSKTINEDLIEEHWDEILRLVVTIKLKENTASDIFRRLNSYSKQHKLYAALKAFGRIIKSIFIMQYIDDVELRQAIEKQLNRIELANRFTRAVAVGNPREFTNGEKEEQEIAESCNRLIKNSIICWNYMYLEKKLQKSDSQEQDVLMHAIKTHSPMSWAHINMLGEYDFSEEKMKDSYEILPTKIIV